MQQATLLHVDIQRCFATDQEHVNPTRADQEALGLHNTKHTGISFTEGTYELSRLAANFTLTVIDNQCP